MAVCESNVAIHRTQGPQQKPSDIAAANSRVEIPRARRRRVGAVSAQALLAAANARDSFILSHPRRVAAFAESIGTRMRLPARQLERLYGAALLHDVGKLAVPGSILRKPGPLTPAEFSIVRRHPAVALEILGHVSFLAGERPIILHHHERCDGQGYPGGLNGNRIPVAARILAVADALDAMFSARSYKPPYDIERVRSELAAGAGRQFDADVAEVALSWLGEEAHEHVLGALTKRCSDPSRVRKGAGRHRKPSAS